MYKQYVGFKGHIFIIMDKVCFSSAQMMLDETQGNKRFTILGDEKAVVLECMELFVVVIIVLWIRHTLFYLKQKYYVLWIYLITIDKNILRFQINLFLNG